MSGHRPFLQLAAVVLLLGAPGLRADITANLSGVIRDPQGAVVSDAQVTITNEGTGLRRKTTASSVGEYRILELPIGAYRLEVEAPGFRKYVQSGIVLSVNQSARNDVTMTLGAVTQEVTVYADVGMVDTSVSAVKYRVDSARMTEIPLAGRNVLDLAILLPGVIGSGNSASVNGSRPGNTNYQLDGADGAGTDLYNPPNRNPPPDAIEEFTVLTNSYTAQYGQGAAVINAVSKSGTNQIHASVWEFLRNNRFNARNFFAGPTVNKYQYNLSYAPLRLAA